MNPPLSTILRPMLVHEYADRLVERHYPLLVQPKLNGIRAMWHNGVLRSRDGKKFSDKVLPQIYKILRETCADVTMDGELYVHSWPLQRINSACAVKRKEPSYDSQSVCYCVYDYPFQPKRFEVHEDIMCDWHDSVVSVYGTKVADKNELRSIYHQALRSGYEGLIIRLPGPYEPGKRSYTALKLKPWLAKSFHVTGITDGKGKHYGTTGALVCCTTDGKVFTAGSGLSDGDRAQIWEARKVGKVVPCAANIKFECFSGDGIPLKPTVLDYTYDASLATPEHLSMEPVRHHNI